MVQLYFENDFKNVTNNSDVLDVMPFTMPDYTNIVVGKLRVGFDGKRPILNIPNDVNGEYLTKWRQSPGTILTGDIKAGRIDSYFYVHVNNVYYLLRKIDEDFYNVFPQFNDYYDVQILDNRYIIISISTENDFSKTYNANDFDIVIVDTDDEEYEEIQSVSLFEIDDLADNLE